MFRFPVMLLLLTFSSSVYSISLIVHFHHLVFFSTLLFLVFKYINSSHHAISHILNPQGFCDIPFLQSKLVLHATSTQTKPQFIYTRKFTCPASKRRCVLFAVVWREPGVIIRRVLFAAGWHEPGVVCYHI